MEFGDRLLMILNEKGMTQRDFAAALSIAPTTLNGYIKNKRQPDFALVKQMAFSLNVSVDYLLDFHSDTVSPDVYELSLIAKLRAMKKNERQIVIDLINLIDKRLKE